jgi:hypothetical protein
MPERNDVERRSGIPPLGPGDAFGLNAQYQSLIGQRSDILGTLAAQRAEVRAAFLNQRAAIRRGESQGVADVENASIGRGVLGGSVDLKSRLGVRANAATQLADALSARNQALLANRSAAMAANRDFEMGLAGLQAQRAAVQATQVATDFLSNAGLGQGATGLGLGNNPQDVSRKDRRQLRAMGRDIENAARAYALATGSAREQYHDQLMAAWRQRNNVRRRLGLTPISRSRLNQYLQSIVEEVDTPGGLL